MHFPTLFMNIVCHEDILLFPLYEEAKLAILLHNAKPDLSVSARFSACWILSLSNVMISKFASYFVSLSSINRSPYSG